jgi:hypothetical protein
MAYGRRRARWQAERNLVRSGLLGRLEEGWHIPTGYPRQSDAMACCRGVALEPTGFHAQRKGSFSRPRHDHAIRGLWSRASNSQSDRRDLTFFCMIVGFNRILSSPWHKLRMARVQNLSGPAMLRVTGKGRARTAGLWVCARPPECQG